MQKPKMAERAPQARDAKRDLGAELLASVREMKAGKAGHAYRVPVSATETVRIASVKHAGGYQLRLRWVNGKTMTVDLSEPVQRLKGLLPLRDEATFARAAKSEGGHSVAWPGEIDMGADRLWEMSLEQNRPA